jgi:hypothetical protein
LAKAWRACRGREQAAPQAGAAQPEIPYIIQHLNTFRLSNRRGSRNNLVASTERRLKEACA